MRVEPGGMPELSCRPTDWSPCRVVDGRIIYMQRVDPDGDGDLHVLLLSAAQGVINAFDVPARQAFVVEMVEDRADLANAIALNSSMVNGTRIIGPSIGGVLIAAFGEGWCFAIDSISYVAVIASIANRSACSANQGPSGTGAPTTTAARPYRFHRRDSILATFSFSL